MKKKEMISTIKDLEYRLSNLERRYRNLTDFLVSNDITPVGVDSLYPFHVISSVGFINLKELYEDFELLKEYLKIKKSFKPSETKFVKDVASK